MLRRAACTLALLSAGCGAKTSLAETDPGALLKPGERPIDPASCVASEPVEVVRSLGKLSLPALARQNEKAMLVFTTEEPSGERKVHSLPITTHGERLGPAAVIGNGFGGTIHSFRRAPNEGAYWLVHRQGEVLVSALLNEQGAATPEPLDGPTTTTVRPAIAASESIAVAAFVAADASAIEIWLREDLVAKTARRLHGVFGTAASAALAWEDPTRIVVGVLDGKDGAWLGTFSAAETLVAQRTIRASSAWPDFQSRLISVVEGPNNPIVIAGGFASEVPFDAVWVEGLGDRRVWEAPAGLRIEDLDAASTAGTMGTAVVLAAPGGTSSVQFVIVPASASKFEPLALELARSLTGAVQVAVLETDRTGSHGLRHLVVWTRVEPGGSVLEGSIIECDSAAAP